LSLPDPRLSAMVSGEDFSGIRRNMAAQFSLNKSGFASMLGVSGENI
jgi:hypothetical protein